MSAGRNKPRFFYGWWIVVGAIVGHLVHGGMFYYGFGTYFEPLIAEFQVSRALLSGCFSMARLEGGILGPIGGFLSDRFGPRKTMLFGVVMMGGSFILLGRAPNIGVFYLVFAMIAVGSGLAFGTTMAAAVGNWFRRKLGIAFGITQTGLGVAGLMIPFISAAVTRYGWRTMAPVQGIIIIALGIPTALLMRHKPEQYGFLPDGDPLPDVAGSEISDSKVTVVSTGEAGFTAKEALRTPVFWLLSFVFALRLMVTVSVPVHIMPFLLDNGFPRETAASALGSIAIVSAAGRIGYGWLGDRLTKRYVVAGLLALLSLSLLFLTQVRSLPQLFIFIAAYAPAYGGLATLMQSIRGEYFGRRSFGTISGWMTFLTMFGTVTGPWFAGYVWDTTGNYRLAFLVFATVAFIALVMVLWAKPPAAKTTDLPERSAT
ncbi:MAG: MFS transporter [Chloroflexota bacterium]